MNEKKKKARLPKKERVWYTIAALFATVGLVFIVFGVIGSHLPVKASENWVTISENAWLINWSHLGYRWWGLILLVAGTLLAVICLTVFAQSGDRDSERAARRAQRLAIENEDEPKVAEAEVLNK